MKKLVVLDPGHGGIDPGASNKLTGLKEKDITLKVSKLIKQKLLDSGVNVVLTRQDDSRFSNDKNTDLSMRAKVANDLNADCLVSIHCNAAENISASGFEIWTTKGNTISDELGTLIYNSWNNSSIKTKMRVDMSDGDPDKESNFAVIYRTRCASCLLEIGFISNKEEAALMEDDRWCDGAATAVANGILKWLG